VYRGWEVKVARREETPGLRGGVATVEEELESISRSQ
jgi:hypothetical protein